MNVALHYYSDSVSSDGPAPKFKSATKYHIAHQINIFFPITNQQFNLLELLNLKVLYLHFYFNVNKISYLPNKINYGTF